MTIELYVAGTVESFERWSVGLEHGSEYLRGFDELPRIEDVRPIESLDQSSRIRIPKETGSTVLLEAAIHVPDARSRLPVTAALTWHELPAKTRQFAQSMGASEWTLGLAAGDDKEGNEGRMLFAELNAQGRFYRVAAGWAVRRADDGYQASGLRGDDTVVTDRDHLHLTESNKRAFNELTSRFCRATLPALQKARSDAVSNATPNIITRSSVGIGVPTPRPYAQQ